MQNKTRRIEIRLSYLERSIIDTNAQKAGLSISEYIRDCALSRHISARRTPIELEAYKNLSDFKTHFSRISSLINEGSEPTLKYEIRSLIDSLNKALEGIRK